MKQKVYLETSFVSYLTSRLSRDLIVAGHQQITQEWWEKRRGDFSLFASQLVIREAGRGDKAAAQKRLHVLLGLPLIGITNEVQSLARRFLSEAVVPVDGAADAVHIAAASVHGMDYLLTWNCAHIANAEIGKRVIRICHCLGYDPPIICTPEELLGV